MAVGEGGLPSGRPHKQLLAGAAIAGTLLIGVPLLFLGLGDDGDKTDTTGAQRNASGTVLQGDRSGRQGPDGYAPASNSPSMRPSLGKTTPAHEPRGQKEAAQKEAQPAPRSGGERPADEPSTTPNAAPKGAPKAETSKRAERPAAPRAKKDPAAPPAKKARTRVAKGNGLPQGANFRTVKGVVLKNRMTGMCADVPGYGMGALDGPVNQFTCDGSSKDNQRWDLIVGQKRGGPGDADLFSIRNSKDGYCLDLPDGGAKPSRTGIFEWHCNPGPGDNQMWYLDKKANGAFWIRNHASSNRCLDVSGYYGSGGRDAHLTLFDCDAKDDHLWSFS